ncbi:MAG TPA: tyrosine-type recombinase/integrase [Methanocorpusculum sp.]|nr:tyrosine-type recombinase/integrase [Methanocorpusculum sp.]HJJ40472.1 tyrosine-type recombinase/integrase [Methanocorpusculum sp.]HJJ49814.1 tyrosine-type recombinase/integrase [Methanocorpusculum sp.]HJJ57349.1 tyrosine-type recombinase/integrase [Methanocorpusculum sp.]
MRNQRFHRTEAAILKEVKGYYKKALDAGKITQQDAELIQEFTNELSGSVGALRELKLVGSLILNRQHFPEYSTITTLEVQAGIKDIMTAVKEDGITPRYKNNTIHDRIKTAKRFFLWMCENGYGKDLNEKKLNKIRSPSPDRMTKTAADILSEDEVKSMLLAARNDRDRALISVIYEAGLRSREIADLTWGDLKFTEWSVVLNTAGKTGIPRYVPLVISRPYLAIWRNRFPEDNSNPDKFVFVGYTASPKYNYEHLPLTYTTIAKIVKETALRAGIEKHITPHIFRHSRITHLIQQGVPETYIKKMMWGTTTTNMFQTYAHIVNTNLDDCMAELHGIERPKTDICRKYERTLEPRQCHRCGTINTPTAIYCEVCGMPLTKDGIESIEMRKAELMEMIDDDDMLNDIVSAARLLHARKAAAEPASEKSAAEPSSLMGDPQIYRQTKPDYLIHTEDIRNQYQQLPVFDNLSTPSDTPLPAYCGKIMPSTQPRTPVYPNHDSKKVKPKYLQGI